MKVSILTTSYNYENYISETIESVLNQTYKDFEYIILDDGSTDNSVEIIKKYAQSDNRIRFVSRENKGLIYTMKEGIDLCNGEYIVFLESDDSISPTYIEDKLKVLEKYPDAAVIYNKINLIGDEQRVSDVQKHLEKVDKLIKADDFDYIELFVSNIIPTFSCVMIKKEVAREIPETFDVPKCYDWYFWNYIIQKYQIVYLDKALTTFRLHKQSFSVRKNEKSVYVALLALSEKKYKFEMPYRLFENYKKLTKIEKAFRKQCRVIDKFIYKLLYVQKRVKVFKF